MMRLTSAIIILEYLRKVARANLPQRHYMMLGEIYNTLVGSQKMGWKNYRYLRSLFPDKSPPDAVLFSFEVPQLLYPIFIRRGTPDAVEFVHSVIRESYKHYLPDDPVKFIIDAGAYIGDTTSWYLSRFSSARVVAIEPDPENFQMLARNCNPYGSRVTLLNAGLWPYKANLTLHRAPGGGSDVSVSEAIGDLLFDCIGIDPFSILEEYGAEIIDILKCDIEGAEVKLFSSQCDEWLSRTRTIYVDIHSRMAREVVMAATQRHGFKCREWRELLVFYR